ncbi:Dot/Icm T4SS effector Zinc-dependent metalloprotease LegP [Legionella spiritensis]|uniref:Metalloproteinase-like protein n=1 Tax=Legionella spiritensis TaxID=452 RepID=A0A0W0ZA37_LEGSP|nr:Dot/Icm T4SS effector Zinc-dependent metalloprotease LegP [Legionella spiritensis]KTD65981.1 metalloproteinase-like protein [Legionella spiritensis]SNV48908.1 astacin protease [Legionella spiritensis]VEG91583.1 astacin protease [Legionella spiritensis]
MSYFLRGLFFILATNGVIAAELGQIVVQDPASGIRTLTYEKKNNFAVVEGDILLTSLDNLQHQGAVILPKVGGGRWPNGIVPFEMAEDLPLINKLAVLQAIALWQQHSSLEFVELTSKNRYEYRDYISFIPAAGTTCSSFVGRQGGRQELHLAPRCNTMNTVHEIGHALGLWHEQSRADRSQYIQIVWENIEENHKHNFNQHLTDGKDYGEYDYQSIMHYSPYAFSKNGKQTIVPLQEGVEIGQRKRLSDKDIAAIAAMYPEV